MEDNDLSQETNTKNKNDYSNDKKQIEDQKPVEQKRTHKTKTWLIVGGIIVGVIIFTYVIVRVLATNGILGDDSCPAGKYKVCGPLGDGEEACGCYGDPYISLKPIIYLYPEEQTELTVRLGAPERLTSSYPKYIDGWNVVAYPNGDLIDKSNGNKLYSLYWEGERNTGNLDLNTGFVVKSEDVASFLEEKLDVLGLNYREKEEFIVYWLPKLETNKYSYIYFATEEEINAEMPLDFSVQPDTIIRVRMIFKGLDEYKNIKKQTLKPAPERNGFTAVEWGGIEL